MKNPIINGLRTAAAATLVSTAIAGAFFLATYLTVPSDRSGLVDRIDSAFRDGTLPSRQDRPNAPAHIGNDCLIFSGLILPYESRIKEAVSPKKIKRYCDGLWQYMNDTNSDLEIKYYHRYLHGWRLASLILLTHFSVGESLQLFFTVGLLLILLMVGLSIWRFVAALRTAFVPSTSAAERSIHVKQGAGTLIIAINFSLFFGFVEFGARFTYGIQYIIIFAFILLSQVTDLLHMRRLALVGLMSAFGALVAHFDFLTGGAPLGLALLIGLMALRGCESDSASDFWSRIFAGSTAYTIGFVTCFALKFAAVALVFGVSEIQGTSAYLLDRAAGPYADEIDLAKALQFGWDVRNETTYSPTSLLFAVAKLAYSSANIAFGSRSLGIGILAVSVLAFAYGTVGHLRRKHGHRDHVFLALVLSLSVIVAWYILFLGHTIVHTRYMVRLLVWPIAVSHILAVFAIMDGRLERRRTFL